MFSSPSRGTPRRRLGGASSSVRSATGTPIGRSSTPTLAKNSSRHRGGSVASNDFMTEGSVRGEWSSKRREKVKSEIEEGAVLSRDELHAVTVYCRLPVEVTATLQKMGVYDPTSCALDAQTGFAHLVVHDRCFVWSFAGRGLDSPPCFTFPVPTSSTSSSSIISRPLPFCSLISRGGDREPGLIILTQSGDLRFCDNVASSFGSERMVRLSIPLGSGESVSALHRCGKSLFLAATTQSRLFSVRFIASGGTLQAQISPFTQSRGLFGRLFGTASQFGSNKGIVSVSSCLSHDNSGAFDVYAMGQSVLQKWSVVEGGGETLLLEEDLKQLLLNQMDSLVNGKILTDSLALVDLALTSHGTAGVLFSYATVVDGPLSYHIALVESASSAPSLTITSSLSLKYSRYPDSRPYSQPRLLLPYGGPVAFIVFPEAVVMKLVSGQSFEEVIEMRDVAANRIIGVGAEGTDVEAPVGISNLSVVAALSGALLIEVDTQRAQELDFQLSSGTDKLQVLTQRLKSKIERGVFHFDDLQNPISLDLPLEIEGNLMTAVEQLSDEIVQSQSPGLSNSVDLRVQLADRLEKLHGLASFIAQNDKMNLLSQNARRKLCSDAELVAAAIDIWEYHNDTLAQGMRRETITDPLGASIKAIIESSPDVGWEGDLIRFFFRRQLHRLTGMLAKLNSNVDQGGGPAEQTANLIRVNHILLSTFQAAFRYRSEAARLHHLDLASISFEAWTCRSSNIHLLQHQFKATVDALQDRKIPMGASMDEDDLGEEVTSPQEIMKGQLCDLASCTLDIFGERLAYLQAAGGGNSSLEKECRLLQDEYRLARSQIILSLVDIGRSDRSFYLAEKHKDFRVLTQLCYTLKGTKQAMRIRSYLEKYKRPFAFELYDYYVQEGHLEKLLGEEEEYHDLLSEFLRSREEYNRIAWLHDLNLKEWSQASHRLRIEAVEEKDHLESKQLMLSLSKLSYVAQLQEPEIALVGEQQRIEIIDDQLDIINVHQKIREDFGGHTAQRQVANLEEVLENTTEVLGEASPALKDLYFNLAKRLVEGAVLSSEDLIDLLTLPDGTDETIEGYNTAIEVFVRAKDIPAARMPEVLACLWRRIILHDDWLEVTDTALASTSDEVLIARMKGTALYQTIKNASENKATSEVILSPSDSLLPFSIESIGARFREESQQKFLESIQADYNGEVARAKEIIEIGISRGWFDDVMRLIKQAQEEADETRMAIEEDESQFMTVY